MKDNLFQEVDSLEQKLINKRPVDKISNFSCAVFKDVIFKQNVGIFYNEYERKFFLYESKNSEDNEHLQLDMLFEVFKYENF